MKEHSRPIGIFHLKAFNAAGELIEEYTETNLIVGGGRQAQSKLLGGASGYADKIIDRIAFGTDGTAPENGDTAVTDPFTKVVTPTYPDNTSVVFTWALSTSEANGKAIQEFGLLCVDNTLFARRTRAVINKTSDLRLEGSWKIQY